MSFALDIAKFAKKCGDRADVAVKSVVFNIGKNIINRSPVGDPSRWEGWKEGSVSDNKEHWLVKAGFVGEGYTGGHFRANWQLKEGSIPSGEIDGVDKEGVDTLNKALSVLADKPAGKVFYWGNALPYAIPLENGHSKVAPHGMVGLTLKEHKEYVREAMKTAKAVAP